MGLTHERKKLLEKLEEVEAFLFLTFQLIPANKIIIESIRKNLGDFNKNEIKQKFEKVNKFLLDPSKEYGLKVIPAELVRLYKERIPPIGSSENKIFYSGKWELRFYFRKPEKFFGELWTLLPSHTLIGYILEQTFENRFEWYLPEAQTYMDMCASINSLVLTTNQKTVSIVDHRKIQSDIKGAILQSYIFLEAYLNGIALDYYFDTNTSIKDDDKESIFEWDFLKKRRKYLTTRDKLFKYIKLITGKNCPLSEDNCPEMKFIFNDLEDFRDSIVHPTIVAFTGTKYTAKISEHLRHRSDFALEAADNVIKLIRKIDKLVCKDKVDSLFWLLDRNDKGLFPEEVFL